MASFDLLTEFGIVERPKLADQLDSMGSEFLEQRFIQHGTVIVTSDGALLQAVKIVGTRSAREVRIAPSVLSSRVSAAAKIKASEVHFSTKQATCWHTRWVRRPAGRYMMIHDDT